MIGVSLIMGTAGAGDVSGSLPGFWQAVRDGLKGEDARVRHSQDEVIRRETKFLQGSLMTFLATPLRSDLADINRLHTESLTRAVESVTGRRHSSGVGGTLGILAYSSSGRTGDRELVLNTRRFLAGNVTPNDKPGDTCEAEIFVTLQQLLDVEMLGKALPPALAAHQPLRICSSRILGLVGEGGSPDNGYRSEQVMIFRVKGEDFGQTLWTNLRENLERPNATSYFTFWRNGLLSDPELLYELRVNYDRLTVGGGPGGLIETRDGIEQGGRLVAAYTRTMISGQGRE